MLSYFHREQVVLIYFTLRSSPLIYIPTGQEGRSSEVTRILHLRSQRLNFTRACLFPVYSISESLICPIHKMEPTIFDSQNCGMNERSWEAERTVTGALNTVLLGLFTVGTQMRKKK